MLLDPTILIQITDALEALCDAATIDNIPAVRSHIASATAWLSHLDTIAEAVEPFAPDPAILTPCSHPNGPSYDPDYDYDPDPSTTPN